MRVLILSGRAPVALDHARRFSAQGWTTYVADSVACGLCSWSRAVNATFSLPPPRTALAEFAGALRTIIEREKIDLLIPTCEEVFYLSKIRHRLPAFCHVSVSPFEQLQQLHSKWSFLQLAKTVGLPVPESSCVNDAAEARDWAGGRPLVLKPEFSRFGVHVRRYPEGMPREVPALPVTGPWIAQRFEHGRELCSYSIASQGAVTAHVAYLPKYRLSGSSSYYFEPLQNPVIEAHVERLVSSLRFTGQISFDWIERRDGQIVALECNPRATSGLHLFDTDASLPQAFAEDIPRVRVTSNPNAARMLGPVMLTAGLRQAIRTRTLASWYRDWMRARDVLFVAGDARPLIGALADVAAFAGAARRRRCSLRAATTEDIEWNGEPLCEL